MHRVFSGYSLFAFVLFSMALSASAETQTVCWPAWRGPDGSGVVLQGNPPLKWSETENVQWKTDLPGEGQSTPVIWDDKLFLQTAEPLGEAAEGEDFPVYRFSVLCLDRRTGTILWSKALREERPHEGHHKMTTFSPFTPVTDGERLWVSFGSRGLFCLNFDGEVLWDVRPVQMEKDGKFGEGGSPVLSKDSVIVLADHEGPSRLYAFDKNTGAIRWETPREFGSSWGTPVVATVGDHEEIITTADDWAHGYNAANGELLWSYNGLTSCAAPSPVIHDGAVYVTTGYEGDALAAITLGRKGELAGTDAIRWKGDTTGSEVATPLIHENRLYVFRRMGPKLSCYNATTGAMYYEHVAVPEMKNTFASPLAVGPHIYINGREGATAIIKSADQFEVVAINKLDTTLDASPVVIGDVLYLRGNNRMYCIAAK